MSKKSIYVKHQDDIFKKLFKVMENVKPDPQDLTEDISVWYDEWYIKALKWVLGLDEKDEEVYVVKTNQRYRKALNKIQYSCNTLIHSSPDAEYFEDIFSTCTKALENKEDEDE